MIIYNVTLIFCYLAPTPLLVVFIAPFYLDSFFFCFLPSHHQFISILLPCLLCLFVYSLQDYSSTIQGIYSIKIFPRSITIKIDISISIRNSNSRYIPIRKPLFWYEFYQFIPSRKYSLRQRQEYIPRALRSDTNTPRALRSDASIASVIRIDTSIDSSSRNSTGGRHIGRIERLIKR